MEEKKTKSTGKTVTIVILSILLVASLGFTCYDKLLKKEETKTVKNNINKNNKEEKEETNTDIKEQKCTGTYYGEYNNTNESGLTVDLKYTYTLNNDSTFTADFNGVLGTNGVYTINDNTVSFTGKTVRHTVGPREEDPYYSTVDYVIADDCSYILYNDEKISFKLNKK